METHFHFDNALQNLKPFQVKDELNPNFFDKDGKFNSRIRLQLLDIVDDFIDTLEMDWIKPKDILLIGSIVNYNWNEYSDLDVNIVYNFNDIYPKNTEFVKDYFYAKRNDWNRKHEELLIKGVPVEITVVDENNMGVATGVYSLEKNEWVKKPKHLDNNNLDKEDIKKFCLSKIKEINDICDKIDTITDKHKLQKLNDELINIEDDLWDIRQDGLSSKDKEMSDGNIKYKVLKHMGYVDKLRDYQNKSYDKCNSIKEGINHKIIRLSEQQIKKIKHYIQYNNREYKELKSLVGLINKKFNVKFPTTDNVLANLHKIIQKPFRDLSIIMYNGLYDVDMFKKVLNYPIIKDSLYLYWKTMNTDQILTPKNVYKKRKEVINPHINHVNFHDYMPAADMENFINTDDTSELSEKIFK